MGEMVQDACAMNHLIHRAIRRDLRRFETALGAFSAGDRERAAALADMFGHFDFMVTDHHSSEETHLWPGRARLTCGLGSRRRVHDRTQAHGACAHRRA